jgi:hypothetical protein
VAATKTALGSWFCQITSITLQKTASETVAHGLPTTPNLVAIYVKGSVSTATFQGSVGASAVDATNIVFVNHGDDTVNAVCTAGYLVHPVA